MARLFGWGRSASAAKRGSEALRAGRLDEAVEMFSLATQQDPTSSSRWFNLGLAHKLRRDWSASLVANRRAAELDGRNEEALWNMGVAATALRDWEQAKWAWSKLEIDAEEGTGPPHTNYGIGPVRLNADTDGAGEVVWGWRIDPCRMRLHSVPLVESGHRWDDVVLHDVVPRGERTFMGRTYPVFDELERMDPSPHETHEVEVTCPTETDSEELASLFYENGLGAEDWTAKLRWICASCSVQTRHSHDADGSEVLPATRAFGLAGPPDRMADLLAQWKAGSTGREVGGPMSPA